MNVVAIKTILIGLLLMSGSFFSWRFFKQRVTTTQLTQETTLSALGGTFTAPQNWYATTHKDMVVLEDPDREVSVVLFATKAANAALSLCFA